MVKSCDFYSVGQGVGCIAIHTRQHVAHGLWVGHACLSVSLLKTQAKRRIDLKLISKFHFTCSLVHSLCLTIFDNSSLRKLCSHGWYKPEALSPAECLSDRTFQDQLSLQLSKQSTGCSLLSGPTPRMT